jgi:hypothetical protein
MWRPPPSGTYGTDKMQCLSVGYNPLWSVVITLTSLIDWTPFPWTAGKVRFHEQTWREAHAGNNLCTIECSTAIKRFNWCLFCFNSTRHHIVVPDLTGDPVLPCMNFGCFSRPVICPKTQDCNSSQQNCRNPLRMSAASIRFLPFRVEKWAVLFL